MGDVTKINLDINDEDSTDDLETETLDVEDTNIPLDGSPLYPRIFLGDSAKPLMGQFHDSSWVDDNISRTWLGLLSYYG